MSERDQPRPSGGLGRVLRCDEWENLLADALDGSLSAADAAAFTRHHQECALCAQMLKETQQGKAWLEYLALEPEAPAGLLEKVLARTSGQQAGNAAADVALPVHAVPARPAWHRRMTAPQLRQAARQVLEPRLLMTAAMAFFSIALTLNLTGIKLTEIRPADLQPARLRVNLTRQYYSTNEQVMKYYENLRVVYEMEARVRELRRSTEDAASPRQSPTNSPSTNSPNDAPKQPARDGSGSPSSAVPAPQGKRSPAAGDDAQPAMLVLASPPVGPGNPTQVEASFARTKRTGKIVREVFRALRLTAEDQAGRSLV